MLHCHRAFETVLVQPHAVIAGDLAVARTAAEVEAYVNDIKRVLDAYGGLKK